VRQHPSPRKDHALAMEERVILLLVELLGETALQSNVGVYEQSTHKIKHELQVHNITLHHR
jgi:hypothetical protein